MSVTCLQAYLENGLDRPNFFNGRVLTAGDLRQEQAANRQRSRWLARAVGSGVIDGLFVGKHSDGTSLIVSPGQALNREGDVLSLDKQLTLALVLEEQQSIDEPFGSCDAEFAIDGEGAYLFAITSASDYTGGAAPHSGIVPQQQNCNLSSTQTEGLQFKLIHLKDYFESESDKAPLLRSELANALLGVASAWESLIHAPFNNQPRYNLLDDLRVNPPGGSAPLQPADVPLALVFWENQHIHFVDIWSARRPAFNAYGLAVEQPFPSNVAQFLPHSSPRLTIEQQAFFLQFQHHLADLYSPYPSGGFIQASAYFTHLPAAGYLPFPPGAVPPSPAPGVSPPFSATTNLGTLLTQLSGLLNELEVFMGRENMTAQPLERAELREILAVERAAGVSRVEAAPAAAGVATPGVFVAGETSAGEMKWWQRFFNNPDLTPPRAIDPAYIREIFHRANYVQPLAVPRNEPVMDVELFSVLNEPYYIFQRRQAVSVVDCAEQAVLVVAPLMKENDRTRILLFEESKTPYLKNAQGVRIAVGQYVETAAVTMGPLQQDEIRQQMKSLTEQIGSEGLSDNVPTRKALYGIYVFACVPPGGYIVEVDVADDVRERVNTVEIETVQVVLKPGSVQTITVDINLT